jgi:mRNA interferase HigB
MFDGLSRPRRKARGELPSVTDGGARKELFGDGRMQGEDRGPTTRTGPLPSGEALAPKTGGGRLRDATEPNRASMWIIRESELKAFYRRYPDAKGPLVAWMKEMDAARYETPVQIKEKHRSADFVKDKVIFDVGGNKYRLIVRFRYARPLDKPPKNGIAKIVFVGTHKEYDKLDVESL